MSLSTPLMGDTAAPRKYRWVRLWLGLIAALLCYVALGALERLAYAQMALVTAKSSGVLLTHTLLAFMGLGLFVVLQLARSQSGGPPISEQLQQVNVVDLLQMAVLDALHSLLALLGASSIPGSVQALLLQVAPTHACSRSHASRPSLWPHVSCPLGHLVCAGIVVPHWQGNVPMVMLFSMLLPAVPPPGEPSPPPSARLRLLYMIHHLSPAECACHVASSHATYSVLACLLV